MEKYLNEANMALVTTYAVRVVGVLVLLFIARIVAGWAGKLVAKSLERTEMEPALQRFFSNFARYTVLVLAVLALLGVFGVQTASFAALIAALGFAVGLAMQGTLSNFSAGVMLLTFRPFRVGDVVKVAGEVGKVHEIELFTTALDTPDNRRLIIPNGTVFGNTIENISFHDTRRVDVGVGTDYSAALDQTRQILHSVAEATPNRLPDRDTQIVLTDLGDSSINWQIRVWCKAADYWGVKEHITNAVKKALDSAGVGIPFPQMDVHVDGALQRN